MSAYADCAPLHTTTAGFVTRDFADVAAALSNTLFHALRPFFFLNPFAGIAKLPQLPRGVAHAKQKAHDTIEQ
jgi:hypothetical protein